MKDTSYIDQLRARSNQTNEEQQRHINLLQAELDNHSARERESKLRNDRYSQASRVEQEDRANESAANRMDIERLQAQIRVLEERVVTNSHLENDIGEIRSGLHHVVEKVGAMREEVDNLAREHRGARTNTRSRIMRESGVQASEVGRDEHERFRRSNVASPPTMQRRRDSISSNVESAVEDDEDRTPRASRYAQKATSRPAASHRVSLIILTGPAFRD